MAGPSLCWQGYMADALWLEMENHYRLQHLRLWFHCLTAMQGHRLAPADAVFVQQSIKQGVRVNLFLVIDAEVKNTSVRTLSDFLIGGAILDSFKAGSLMAQNVVGLGNTWYDTSPKKRGGWRGLLLASRTNSWNEEQNLLDIQQEVASFSEVLALGTDVKQFLSKVIECVGIDRTGSLWDAFVQLTSNSASVLSANMVRVVFKEREATSVVECREISMHNPPSTLWGLRFPSCPTWGAISCGMTLVPGQKTAGRVAPRIVEESLWRAVLTDEGEEEGIPAGSRGTK
ncbi:hypothetical protein PAXINDRAFT_157447 [Paxillus involutus ATCC 200175]|uniref:Uncharacterized protein n=1 Tax=Paxillus involutus ATCC 200175 TaxID=664439 RepID=A0A0C9T5R4_PAXIN|nr:hypothetical protein PAXINDRAFT_157447 [Paxillus involutus ATCC 200175]